MRLSFISYNRCAYVFYVYFLLFPYGLWSVGDFFNQNFLFLMGLSRSHFFIGFRKSLWIRVRNTILGPRVLPYFSLLHCGGLFLNPFQANGLWAQGGNILQLDHIFKLLHSLLTPLALRSNQDELPWHAKICWSHPVSNSHTLFLLRKLLAKAHPLFFSLGSNNR